MLCPKCGKLNRSHAKFCKHCGESLIKSKEIEAVVQNINEALGNEQEYIEKLKKILKVSTRVKLDIIRDILKMEKSTFYEKIFNWAAEFGFIIDGDYLLTNKSSSMDLIDAVEKDYNIRIGKEKKPINKRVELKSCYYCGNSLDPNANICPYCGISQKEIKENNK